MYPQNILSVSAYKLDVLIEPSGDVARALGIILQFSNKLSWSYQHWIQNVKQMFSTYPQPRHACF